MVVTGADEAGFAAAAKAVKTQLAFYGSTPAYRPVLELHGWGDLQTELNTLSKRGAWEAMADLIDDEMLTTFAVVGELDDIAGLVLRAVRGPRRPVQLLRPLSHGARALGRGAGRLQVGAGTAGQTTMLTSLGARTMTRRGAAPASASTTAGEARARASASSSAMSGATSMRSRTLPLTWTTMVTDVLGHQLGVGHRPRAEVDVVAVPALPRLGGHVRGHRGQQQQQGVDGLADHLGMAAVADVGLDQVHELHARGHRRVVGPPLEVAGDPVDQPVGGPADGQVLLGERPGRRGPGAAGGGTASRQTRSR